MQRPGRQGAAVSAGRGTGRAPTLDVFDSQHDRQAGWVSLEDAVDACGAESALWHQ